MTCKENNDPISIGDPPPGLFSSQNHLALSINLCFMPDVSLNLGVGHSLLHTVSILMVALFASICHSISVSALLL